MCLFSPNALVCSTFTANLKKESKNGSLDRESFETLTKIKYRGNNVKKKKNKSQTVGTVSKSNRKILDRGKFNTPNTQ